MTRVHLPDQCLEEGCQNPGGKTLLCEVHAPQYSKTPSPPCHHGAECDGRGIDCGPDTSRKKAAPKPAAEMTEIRARAWATRRAKYGERGHCGSYSR